jgi:acetoin utilization deacetylase AcuC-like enzyme
MKTICSDAHRAHHVEMELSAGRLIPCFEQPSRADAVRAQIEDARLGPMLAPVDHGLDPITAIHAPDYVDFLEHAWQQWTAAGGRGDAFGDCTPMRDMGSRVPRAIRGRLGYYSFDSSAPITAGTWTAAYDAAQIALTGADQLLHGEPAVFGLCRPPGHHASTAYFGGYCYLNNAAIAAQSLLDHGMARVAILDVDYHHGNGTQSIFYSRNDVLFASIHGDPDEEYPYFSGHAQEMGAGPGEGCNLNFPLPTGSDPARWFAALDAARTGIREHGPEAVVVSLGVDTFVRDPISTFKLRTDDYLRLGREIGDLALPTLFVLEGGYAIDAIGLNVTNVLLGFEYSAGTTEPER